MIYRIFKVLAVALIASVGLFYSVTTQAFAHEVRPALLQISEQEPGQFDVIWKVPVLDGKKLDMQVVMPPVMEALTPPSKREIPGAEIEYSTYQTHGKPIFGSEILIDGLSTTQIDVLLEITLFDGTLYSTILRPSTPSFVIPKSPSNWNVAKSYFRLGVEHILSGFDHLVFVFALMLLIRNNWTLIKSITAFTIAHSITLGVSVLGIIHVPPIPTEAVIALSIVFLAAEILRSRQGISSLSERKPWIVAFVFGLFHGLGFAGALIELGLPQQAVPAALLSFNLGVETGQLMFIGLIILASNILAKLMIDWPKNTWKIFPYAIGGLASFWFLQRMEFVL
ncbi:MAG: HupE/UreJ family protein [Paracoccaceae bacterium]